MDITFKTESGVFKYRVCAVICDRGRLLVMHDELSPYYYLPGGRPMLHERAEDAILREVKEELGVDATILRPLWLNQNFYNEVIDGNRYHELCIYFLIDVGTSLVDRGDSFIVHEDKHVFRFEWLPFERLQNEYLYPVFVKTAILSLPDTFTLL